MLMDYCYCSFLQNVIQLQNASGLFQSYGNIAPHLGDTKCPTNSMEFPFPTIKNHGSLQNARDHGYDSLQNHMPWSICTGPRLTYFVAVIPTSIDI